MSNTREYFYWYWYLVIRPQYPFTTNTHFFTIYYPASTKLPSKTSVVESCLSTLASLHLKRYLTSFKVESCTLQADNLLKRNSIRDHFLDIFCKFQGTIKKFG